ncbi:MAG TPA: hypothetical protein VGP93_15665, partial [Polyangiaceae bacterium]|nr:hypothetical protein [Polyangiaceae bacterium]
MFSAGISSSRQQTALAVAALWAAGCESPRAAYEDFVQRSEQIEAGTLAGSAGACTPPAPGSVSGPTLIAIGTTISPGRPILFFGQVDTPEQDGKTAVLFRYHPLDATDRRTEVGDELVLGPYAI